MKKYLTRQILNSDLKEFRELCELYKSKCDDRGYILPCAPSSIVKAGLGVTGYMPPPDWGIVKRVLSQCIKRGTKMTIEEFYEIENSSPWEDGVLY